MEGEGKADSSCVVCEQALEERFVTTARTHVNTKTTAHL